jgi:hypothetical protein
MSAQSLSKVGPAVIALFVWGCLSVPPPCDEGELWLSFQPTNVGRCVAEPAQSIEVPEGEEWWIDTDDLSLESGEGESEPPPLLSAEVVDQEDGPQLLVVSVQNLIIGRDASLRARGSRPLVIVASEDIEVQRHGVVSVRSFRFVAGAGMDDGRCRAEGGRGGDGEAQEFGGVGDAGEGAGTGGSGGGGGGYGAAGGQGAPVNGSGGDPSPGGAANDDEQNQLSPLRGGCSGGDGLSVTGGSGGQRGEGGGAVQLIANGSITIEGSVSASGGGGASGDEGSGGGGGGSGGAVLLEAPRVAIAGALTANGGGGGLGPRRLSDGCERRDGEHGRRDFDIPAAGAISPCATPGHGGDGGAAGTPEGSDGEEGDSELDGGGTATPRPAGGGGGGGGVGRIRISTCDDFIQIGSAVFSPIPVISALACRD